MARRIIIVGPKFFGYSSAIVQFLNDKKGVDATFIDERGYNSSFHKSVYRSNLLTHTFKFLIDERRREIYRQMEEYRPTDIIFISPEYLCCDDFNISKRLNCRTVLYMWDSFSNKPSARSFIGHFDRCMSFDFEDSKDYGMELLNLFAEPQFFNTQNDSLNKKYDVSFVGTLHSDRINYLIQLTRICEKHNLSKKIHGYYGNYFYFAKAKLVEQVSKQDVGTWQSLTKKETAKIFQESSIVLDITHPEQRGLTSRTFEALAAGATILTNNKNAKEYLNDYASKLHIFSASSFEADLMQSLNNLDSQFVQLDTFYLSLERFCEELLG